MSVRKHNRRYSKDWYRPKMIVLDWRTLMLLQEVAAGRLRQALSTYMGRL